MLIIYPDDEFLNHLSSHLQLLSHPSQALRAVNQLESFALVASTQSPVLKMPPLPEEFGGAPRPPPNDRQMVMIPVDDMFSDGDESTWPTDPSYQAEDPAKYLEKLAKMWMQHTGEYKKGQLSVLLCSFIGSDGRVCMSWQAHELSHNGCFYQASLCLTVWMAVWSFVHMIFPEFCICLLACRRSWNHKGVLYCLCLEDLIPVLTATTVKLPWYLPDTSSWARAFGCCPFSLFFFSHTTYINILTSSRQKLHLQPAPKRLQACGQSASTAFKHCKSRIQSLFPEAFFSFFLYWPCAL